MKTNKLLLTFIFLGFLANAQDTRGIIGNTSWTNLWTNYKPKVTPYRDAEFILTGEIKTNTTLTRNNCYLLAGNVVVKPNVTLTIEPGTIIKGDFITNGTLIIEAGAKIIANGTETDPIIFTSNKLENDRNPGDWGGIIILGNASISKLGGLNDLNLDVKSTYGGKNDLDTSGILKFVRIEFAGKKIGTKSYNALTLAGIGSKTKIEFVQISFANNNGVEVLGGKMTLKNMVTFKNNKRDFNFSEGAQIELSNSLAFRFPYFSDTSSGKCIEVNAFSDLSETNFSKNVTNVIAQNITLVNLNDKSEGLTREAVLINNKAKFSLINSVVNGFSPAISLNSKISFDELVNVNVKNNVFNNCKDGVIYNNIEASDEISEILKNYYEDASLKNEFNNLELTQLFNVADFKSNSDFKLKINNEKNTVTNR